MNIDFVVLWVDGNDPDWQTERAKYTPCNSGNSATINRFRDWGLMKYWFRGVEKNAPWVNHIFFVTCGHYPEWLDLSNPKITLVKHSDFIPHELLPTFNSNVIEMRLHKLEGLSEHFVLFNDDMFLISKTTKEDFFVDGLPCESALLGILSSVDIKDIFPHILVNNSALINKYFKKGNVLKKNMPKFFSLKYGADIWRNILLYAFKNFSLFRDFHLASSLTKQVYEEIWNNEPDVLYNATKERFRSKDDVNQYLLKAWYMCKGEFSPRNPRWGKTFELGVDKGITDYITRQKGKIICINDSAVNYDFVITQQKLIDAFEKILPEKSTYEK